MKGYTHPASAARAAPQIAITTTGKSVGKENNVAGGSDDGGAAGKPLPSTIGDAS